MSEISSSVPAGAPYPWLLADIGGSNARFAWVPHAGAQPQQIRTLAVADHPTLLGAAQAYLEGLAQVGMPLAGLHPGSAAFAVATAVGGERIDFTNSSWGFERGELAAQLGLRTLLVLNDFEALALSLPRLRPQQVQILCGREPIAGLPLAVVGPGTGLGVAGLLPHRGAWLAVPGEGGHATLAAHDEHEAALLAVARRSFPHVSAERFLSGIGLPVLYRASAEVLGRPAEPGVDARWIVERALACEDQVAEACIDSFCAMLGGFCGSVALTYGARGGLFIGGGIVPRLGERFAQSSFRARFEAKGRFGDYLRAIPTPLITDTLVALDGAAQALSQAG